MFSCRLIIILIFASLLFVTDAIGQQVVEGSENLLHLPPTDYPSSLRQQGIQGTVVMEAALDEKGRVMDAHVVNGPNQLRRIALKSVLDCHFAPPASLPFTVRVAIQWKLPMDTGGTNPKGLYRPGPRSKLLTPADRRDGILKSIEMNDLRDRLKSELERRLPVRAGQRVEKADWEKVQQAVVEIDEHLELKLITVGSQAGTAELVLQIFHPRYYNDFPPPPPPPPPPPKK
jgi:TonB family protein